MMTEYQLQEIRKKYIKLGVEEKHLEYAINSAKNNVKREYIFQNLTSDVRNVQIEVADELLDDLIIVKKVNPISKILKPFLIFFILLLATFFLSYLSIEKGLDNRFTVLTSIPALIFLFKGIKAIIVTLKNK